MLETIQCVPNSCFLGFVGSGRRRRAAGRTMMVTSASLLSLLLLCVSVLLLLLSSIRPCTCVGVVITGAGGGIT